MSVSGELEMNMCKFTWSLTNFSKLGKNFGDKITSPLFNIKDLQWRLFFYPCGETLSSKDFISIFLNCYHFQNDFEVYYEFVFSDVNGAELKRLDTINLFTPENPTWGYIEFIKRDSLLNKKEKLLDDTLNITCTIHKDVYSRKEVNIQKTILQDYELLFHTGKFSDLTIIIKDNELKVHKNILSVRSQVFKAMFCHDMKENSTNTIKITDVSFSIMKEVLSFIYSGKINDLQKNAKKLLPPAEKYGITELKVLCEKSILKNLKIEDACETLSTADLYQCSELKTKIVEFIIANMKEVNKTPGFKNLNKSNPELFEIIFAKVVEKKF